MTALERDTKRVKENVPSAMRLLVPAIIIAYIWRDFNFWSIIRNVNNRYLTEKMDRFRTSITSKENNTIIIVL